MHEHNNRNRIEDKRIEYKTEIAAHLLSPYEIKETFRSNLSMLQRLINYYAKEIWFLITIVAYQCSMT